MGAFFFRHGSTHVINQTMMTVVEQLDQTLFGNFLNPKVAIATGKLRSGILDPEMDWYETPQPTGTFGRLSGTFFFKRADNGLNHCCLRDSTIYVRDVNVPRRSARTSQRRCATAP